MHELLLFAPVPESSHSTLVHQLAGVTRMQPIPTTEHHLVFRAVPPSGLDKVLQQGSGGGSQGVAAPELKRTRDMLSGSLYHLQLVRDISDETSTSISTSTSKEQNGLPNGTKKSKITRDPSNWTIHFADIPEPGTTSPVTSRLISRTPIEPPTPSPTSPQDALSHATSFLHALGYSPTPLQSYLLHGYKFYDNDTTIFLYQILPLSLPPSIIPDLSTLKPLDPSGAYLLQASIELDYQPQQQSSGTSANAAAAEKPNEGDGGGGGGVNATFGELRAQATHQLLNLMDTLRGSGVVLGPGDRLGLDTRVNLRGARTVAR